MTQPTFLSTDLHQDWTLQQHGKKKSYPAQVPGCVHSDLYRNDVIPDPFYGRNEHDLLWMEMTDWQYRLQFDAPAAYLEQEVIELVADGLDTVATLTLNGTEIAHTENMFVGYRFDIKALLKESDNTLEILFHNHREAILKRQPDLVPITCDPIGGRQQLRKQQCATGWDWGPRLTTCGIWRSIRLEAWSTNRLERVHISQVHEGKKCSLVSQPEMAKRGKRFRQKVQVSLDGVLVAEAEAPASEALTLPIPKAQKWWPNGQGEQPIYTWSVDLYDGDTWLDHQTGKVGLCEIILDQHADQWGTSFQFLVNGRAVFCKGANWIPAHSFVNEGEALIPDLLDSAIQSNMNMLRVWGGGIYELDSFYEQCLERGLMIWQDFQFACGLYPADRAYLKEVKAEATYQIQRLRNHSHIALWCGNNEVIQLNKQALNTNAKVRRDYEKIFDQLLPQQLEKFAPGKNYIPTSEHNPDDPYGDTRNEESGDAHYWGVWHSRAPITQYENQKHRFFSEFGMQAYPHTETASTFTQSQNIFGPEMDNHQKNGGGNQIIFHYISELYRFPKDYASTVYLSQIMQAYCLRFGIEHMRRNQPRTMGSLYWQLNDCWPVASWSSIDFGGRWKALQYAAKRFYAPAMVSVKLIGREMNHRSNNYVISNVEGFEIYTVYDDPKSRKGKLTWELWSISENKVVEKGDLSVQLRYGKSQRRKVLKPTKAIQKYGRNDLVLRTRLLCDDLDESVNTTFLTTPRYVDLPQPNLKIQVKATNDKKCFEVTVRSDVPAYQIYLNLAKAREHRISDNFFDLFPGEQKTVMLKTFKPATLAVIKNNLESMSYRDSHLA
ncbi:glycoside hydrolase family 2 protein [Kiritimatiellota bacterium B12222]|nr:glycoside hydrolase family 2 protein [Kiritimatiellota bacterium B12222]